MYREDVIIPHIAGRKILDCGGIDHSFAGEKQKRGRWLHATLAEHAQRCIGVDILADRVATINRQGKYEFIQGNVEELAFENEFDVVVAGELIEHIYNAGLFLDSVWRALKCRGILIITTPNYHALSLILYSTIMGKEVCHKEHTCYYSKQTLCYLVERHGFAVEEVRTVDRPARSRWTELVRGTVQSIRPGLGETLVIVARKCSNQNKYGDKW